ncbi:hypothetical protein RB594_005916 [Gaeumannomyces avenae]
MEESCCTCATLLSDSRRRRRRHQHRTPDDNADSDASAGAPDEKHLSEKDDEVPDRRLECCARVICGHCLDKNVRFATYCPYCQIATEGHDLSIPSAGLRNPPSYVAATTTTAAKKETHRHHRRPLTPPPPYTTAAPTPPTKADDDDDNKTAPPPPPPPPQDVLHYLDHARDTIPSLSLRYNIPAAALRRANRLPSDHLLPGRRVIVIPAAASASSPSSTSTPTTTTTATPPPPPPPPPPLQSLSPHPVEGAAEERRKAKVRRWMVACREADYDVALLYLDQAAYDLDAAVDAYFADEAWERDNPLRAGGGARGRMGKGRKGAGGHPPSSAAPGESGSSASASAPSAEASAASSSAGRLGFGAAAPGEGGWMWAAQAPFLRRGRKKDWLDPTP